MDEPKPQIVIDDRELRSATARKLFSIGAKLVSKRLAIADFIISDRIAVERKTAEDFERSIMDGRLFSQAREMCANFSQPLLCITGREFIHLQKNSILGAQIALATDFRIPLFIFNSEDEFAEFLFVLAVQKAKQPKDAALRFEKRAFSLNEQLQFVIESVSQIGPVHAKALLKRFKSIERIFTASEEELQKTEGIGEVRAKEIRRVASSKYESEKP